MKRYEAVFNEQSQSWDVVDWGTSGTCTYGVPTHEGVTAGMARTVVAICNSAYERQLFENQESEFDK